MCPAGFTYPVTVNRDLRPQSVAARAHLNQGPGLCRKRFHHDGEVTEQLEPSSLSALSWVGPVPRWKRMLFWSGTFVIACVVYLWFFGAQTFFALQTRKWGRQIPIVNSVPRKLDDLSVSEAKGEKLAFMGAEFDVPWDDINKDKTRIIGNWVEIKFQSGTSIILCVSPPDGFITDISKSKTPDPQLFASIYGQEVLRSDYALQKAIFETTPRQITLFTPANRAAGLSLVLMIKGIMPPTTDWAIFSVQAKNVKGFQLGDPVRRPKKMCLELYTEDAGFEINIEQNTSGPAPGITQEELNRIIQTAHGSARKQAVLTVSPS
jgi:hypothetical protein